MSYDDQLRVTPKGHRVPRVLSEDHAQELYEPALRLIAALSQICGSEQTTGSDRKSTALA
jgi:hypothetical protein